MNYGFVLQLDSDPSPKKRPLCQFQQKKKNPLFNLCICIVVSFSIKTYDFYSKWIVTWFCNWIQTHLPMSGLSDFLPISATKKKLSSQQMLRFSVTWCFVNCLFVFCEKCKRLTWILMWIDPSFPKSLLFVPFYRNCASCFMHLFLVSILCLIFLFRVK